MRRRARLPHTIWYYENEMNEAYSPVTVETEIKLVITRVLRGVWDLEGGTQLHCQCAGKMAGARVPEPYPRYMNVLEKRRFNVGPGKSRM